MQIDSRRIEAGWWPVEHTSGVEMRPKASEATRKHFFTHSKPYILACFERFRRGVRRALR
jgi:hypothetical protein